MQYNAPKLIAATEILWCPKSSISKALTINNSRQVSDSSFTIKVGTVIHSFMIQQLSPDYNLWLSMWLRSRLHKVSMKLHDYQHLKSINLEKINLRYETLMFWESVSIMVSRSIPMPQPAVGGSLYSQAVQKVSSICIASSLPSSLSCIFPPHPQHLSVVTSLRTILR